MNPQLILVGASMHGQMWNVHISIGLLIFPHHALAELFRFPSLNIWEPARGCRGQGLRLGLVPGWQCQVLTLMVPGWGWSSGRPEGKEGEM